MKILSPVFRGDNRVSTASRPSCRVRAIRWVRLAEEARDEVRISTGMRRA